MGDALGGEVAGLVAALDIVGNYFVEEVGGELRAETGVGEPDDIRLRNQGDLELLVQPLARPSYSSGSTALRPEQSGIPSIVDCSKPSSRSVRN